MFTNDNRRNRNAAIITIAAAATFIVSSPGFAAPKRDASPGQSRQDSHIVTIGTPAPYPTGHDVTAAGLRKRDKVTPKTDVFNGYIVRIGTPSPVPTGDGHDITAAGLRKSDKASPKTDVFNGYIVRIGTPSPVPTGDGHDVTAGALRKSGKVTPKTDVFNGYIVTIGTPAPRGNNGTDFTAGSLIASGNGTAASASPASGRTFIQSLDLTSSVRYVGAAGVTAPARNPFSDGRACVSLDRDSQNGLVATAGWSFLLK